MESQTLCENAVGVLTSESCSENTPKNSVTPKPRHVPFFFCLGLGGNAVRFLRGAFSLDFYMI